MPDCCKIRASTLDPIFTRYFLRRRCAVQTTEQRLPRRIRRGCAAANSNAAGLCDNNSPPEIRRQASPADMETTTNKDNKTQKHYSSSTSYLLQRIGPLEDHTGPPVPRVPKRTSRSSAVQLVLARRTRDQRTAMVREVQQLLVSVCSNGKPIGETNGALNTTKLS